MSDYGIFNKIKNHLNDPWGKSIADDVMDSIQRECELFENEITTLQRQLAEAESDINILTRSKLDSQKTIAAQREENAKLRDTAKSARNWLTIFSTRNKLTANDKRFINKLIDEHDAVIASAEDNKS